ncbi:hypothetical protein [Methylobacterium durans]|uniref:Uncharacterized protein n=1 Tax=Methylobacterium durans TaxID=2202825 RepID=A0A2U8W3B2_9HYPH|nr:hypothetical protein [Methylobacterium durans]AWN40121.1 hypothetical protein DK389_05665 [Methylobacterium durans]
MNTANLQLEGLYAAVAGLMNALRDKNLLSQEEIDQAFGGVEAAMVADPGRPTQLSAAHVDAICFPARFLRLANQVSARGDALSFAQLTAEVGRSKPPR